MKKNNANLLGWIKSTNNTSNQWVMAKQQHSTKENLIEITAHNMSLLSQHMPSRAVKTRKYYSMNKLFFRKWWRWQPPETTPVQNAPSPQQGLSQQSLCLLVMNTQSTTSAGIASTNWPGQSTWTQMDLAKCTIPQMDLPNPLLTQMYLAKSP